MLKKTIIKQVCLLYIISLFYTTGCTLGPVAIGEAAAELTFLIPGDVIEISSGEKFEVNSDGRITDSAKDINIIAAGEKIRDVMKQLSEYIDFDAYQIIKYGNRYVEIAGQVPKTGKYAYPQDEDWNIMNLLTQIGGYYHQAKAMQYLLIRKSWHYPGTSLFVRGETLPLMEGIGGDEVQIFSGDRIIFPGTDHLIYVFGEVDNPICFSFLPDSQPTLKVAIENANNFTKNAAIENIQIYRVLNQTECKIFNLHWKFAKKFKLESWDIVYIPSKSPSSKKQ